MTDIVFAHDGTVAKIIGDALHVLFGAPGEQPDHADRAVRLCTGAGRIRAGVSRTLATKRASALGVTRIGVHAGPAIVGNFGGGRFFDYTAYGDTINIAARLEAANKQLGTRICVSAMLADKVEGLSRPADRRPDAARQDRSASRLRATSSSNNSKTPRPRPISTRLPNSRPAIPARWLPLHRHVGIRPQDQLASFHLKRLLNGAKGIHIAME